MMRMPEAEMAPAELALDAHDVDVSSGDDVESGDAPVRAAREGAPPA
mgnify:CR=1 FL=1